nr:MAG TPA: hypothetical protein [Caudoviricetes sp.]
MDYSKITLEECVVYHGTNKTACVCNGDEKKVKFMEE